LADSENALKEANQTNADLRSDVETRALEIESLENSVKELK
jgi:hypothetical protein